MFARSLKQIQDYDPYSSPPDVNIAIKHRLANLVGFQLESYLHEVCPCCYKHTAKQQFSLLCPMENVQFLGEGIILYFKSIKMSIVILGFLLLIFMVEWIIYHHILCRQNCNYSEIQIFSTKLTQQMHYELKFCFIGIIIILILIFIINKYYDIQVYLLQKDKYQAEHFAIMLEGFPKCTQQNLKVWIQKQFGVAPLAIHMIYDTKQIKQIIELKQKDLISLNKQNIRGLYGTTTLGHSLQKQLIQNKQNNVNSKIKRLDSIINKYQTSKSYNQSGSILVLFEKPAKVQQICQKHSQTFYQRIFRKGQNELKYYDSQIQVDKAINPRDCIWQNFQYHQNRLISKIIVSIVFLLLAFLTLYGSIMFHTIVFGQLQWPYSFIISFFCYLFFHLILHFLVEAYHKFCKYKSYTLTQMASYYAYTYFNIFFVCVLPYSTTLKGDYLLEFINLILLVDAFMHPIIKIFNFSNIYRKFFAAYIISLQAAKNPYPQNYFNRIMQGRQFKLGQNHHYLTRGIFLCCFYSHAAPFCFIYYVSSFALQYWTQKYLLLRKCKIPPKFSAQISHKFMQSLSLMPGIYIIGVYNYLNSFYPGEEKYQWIFVVLLVTAKMLSALLIFYFNGKKSQWKPTRSYNEVEYELDEYYELQNDIIKYNGELKELHRAYINKMMASLSFSPKIDQVIDPLLQLQYKNSEVYSPQVKNSRAKLMKRLLSNSIQMNLFLKSEKEI